MRKLREFGREILFCLVGGLIAWAAIDYFGGPDIASETMEDYIEE
ncbi:hypothetical protein [Pontivivens nitratireducens]|nr:hypothetical protein [Pontibrevibacter nitratireducens]